MEEAKAIIEKLLYTMGLIEVHGRDNLARMLGCIQETEKLKMLLEKQTEAK